jgi:hypothetical protein
MIMPPGAYRVGAEGDRVLPVRPAVAQEVERALGLADEHRVGLRQVVRQQTGQVGVGKPTGRHGEQEDGNAYLRQPPHHLPAPEAGPSIASHGTAKSTW